MVKERIEEAWWRVNSPDWLESAAVLDGLFDRGDERRKQAKSRIS